MLRIFGEDVAELPLVATSTTNHGKVREYSSTGSPAGYHSVSFSFSCFFSPVKRGFALHFYGQGNTAEFQMLMGKKLKCLPV